MKEINQKMEVLMAGPYDDRWRTIAAIDGNIMAYEAQRQIDQSAANEESEDDKDEDRCSIASL
jgi:hypothetical protein